MRISYCACACTVLAIACGSSTQAGTVNVSFVRPETFTDAGDRGRDASANLQTIADYLQWLGQKYLPTDQSMQIEILNIDLAGKLRPTFRWGTVRVVGNPIDWPQMMLRYRLESAGQVVASGEESVSDMGYSVHLGAYSGWEALPYEKHMLKDWFRARFAKK